MNKQQDMIATLEADQDRGEWNDRLLEKLLEKQRELGGDCDTLTCITGSIAEAFYGVPEELKRKCRTRLPDELEAILLRFEKFPAEKQ